MSTLKNANISTKADIASLKEDYGQANILLPKGDIRSFQAPKTNVVVQ